MKRLLLCVALLAWSGLLSAGVVYKWVDSDGKVHYGDRPPDGVHAEIVEMVGTKDTRTAPAPAVAAQDSKTAAPAQANAPKKISDEEAAANQQKLCADAQDRYKKLLEGRHLYKTGDDGQRQYMTSEQIDSERASAKQEVDTVCNSS
jgi:Domain of unknown function (DUF4124)